MRLAGSASWQVGCDIPEELQFSGAVGEHAGFSLAADQSPRGPTEAAWRAWWATLLTQTFGVHMDQVAQEMPADSPTQHVARLREAGERTRRAFGPPEFPELAHTPELQQLCRREWPPFQAEWSGGGGQKAVLVGQMQRQLQRVRPDHVVSACTSAAGKSAPAPFALRLDFVRWPHTYLHHVSPRHLLLGTHYLEAAHADALQTVLQAAIMPLV
jgi:hypothetical protein